MTRHAGRTVGFALAVTLAGLVGCGVPPAGDEGEQAREVATTRSAVSACNQLGIPDPGTCSSCYADAAGHWTKACVTADCTLAHFSCPGPIVSCGACQYRFPGPGFTQICTHADGSRSTESCTPPQLPPGPGVPVPRLP
jgi:hypothetical protein